MKGFKPVELGINDDNELVVYVDGKYMTKLNGGGSDSGWPSSEFIVAYMPPKAESNFDNLSVPQSAEEGCAPFGSRYSDNADGAWVEWYVSLAAGTYMISCKPFAHQAAGIISFSLNGTVITSDPYNASAATFDTYSATDNNYAPATTIASDLIIPESGQYVLRATVSGKNASSSGYSTVLVYLYLAMITNIEE
jgi:hypothetical protein